MKRANWLLILLIAAFSTTVSTSCKSKKTAPTTTESTTTTNTPVEINPDVTLRTSVDNVLKSYDGVTADVKDGVITLRGSIKQDDLQSLIMKVQELKPKKVENQLTIKS
jgi:osmotically-inducible protein OsmY